MRPCFQKTRVMNFFPHGGQKPIPITQTSLHNGQPLKRKHLILAGPILTTLSFLHRLRNRKRLILEGSEALNSAESKKADHVACLFLIELNRTHYALSITGITNMSTSSPASSGSEGRMIPARFGAESSNDTSALDRLFSMSIKKRLLKPISISSPV